FQWFPYQRIAWLQRRWKNILGRWVRCGIPSGVRLLTFCQRPPNRHPDLTSRISFAEYNPRMERAAKILFRCLGMAVLLTVSAHAAGSNILFQENFSQPLGERWK